MAQPTITALTATQEGDFIMFRGSCEIAVTESERRIPVDFRLTGSVLAILPHSRVPMDTLTLEGLAAGTGEATIRGEFMGTAGAYDFKDTLQRIGINQYGTPSGPLPDSITEYFAARGISLTFEVTLTATPDLTPGSDSRTGKLPI